jgi:hypothetical protein
MHIDVTLSRQSIEELIRDFAPVRIHLTPTDEDRRWVELDEPSSVEMVPGRGARVVCSGRVRYTLAGIKLPLNIRRIVVLLVPEVLRPSPGSQTLGFGVLIEEADFELVPGLVDRAIVDKVNEALKPTESTLVWDFGKTLTKSFVLPERLEPLDRFELAVRDGSLVVDENGLRLSAILTMKVTRRAERPSDD